MFWSNAPKWVESEATVVDPAHQTVCARAVKVGVGDVNRQGPDQVGGQVAAPDVVQLFLAVAVLAGGDRADAGVGAVGVSTSSSRSSSCPPARSPRH